MAQVNIRINDKLKEEGERLFEQMGISFSSAVNIFISQAVREQALPFRVAVRRPKDITLASEKALAEDWLSPEDEEAWAYL